MSEKPYPGLRPFRRDETDIFFGREAQTDELLERLGRSRFIAVLGLSGCGKSSLVRTGLIAGLESGFLASTGPRWRVAEMRPQNQPLTNLAYALNKEGVLDALQSDQESSETQALRLFFLRAALQRGPLAIQEVLRQHPLPKNTNLLLLVDQFEEIFRYRQLGDRDEADAFVVLLLESSRLDDLPVHVVITMRSDFLGDCAVFRRLPEVINEGLFLVPRLTREQLRNAIEGPARVFGGRLEPRLVNHLLNSVGDDPDQLPVLQHALMRMCAVAGGCHLERRSDNRDGDIAPSFTMTLAHYRQIGGLKEALSQHADEAFESLDASQKGIARRLFQCLSERGSDHRDTRRPLRLGAIANIAEVDWQEVAAMVEHFRQPDQCFLTPPVPTPLNSSTLLDISHESLIRQWHQLNNWVEEEAESAKKYRRLEDAALLWKELKEPKAGLTPPFLDIARQWVRDEKPNAYWAQRYGEHYPLVMEFLHTSEQQHQEAKAREEEAHQQKFRHAMELAELRQQKLHEATELAEFRQRNLQKIRRMLAITMGALGLAAWALIAQYHANARTEKAIESFFRSKVIHAAEFILQEDFLSAKHMLKGTQKLDKEAPKNLWHTRNLLQWGVDFMGGPKPHPSANTEGIITQLRKFVLREHERRMVVAGVRGTQYKFDPKTSDQLKIPGVTDDPGQYSRPQVELLAMDFRSPWLASLGRDVDGAGKKYLTLENLDEKVSAKTWPVDKEVYAMALNPKGTQLAVSYEDDSIALGDPRTGAFRPLGGNNASVGHTRPVYALSFDCNSRKLLSLSWDETVLIWNIETGKPRPLGSNASHFKGAVAFHPTDGQRAAIGKADGSIELWDIDDAEPSLTFAGHPGHRLIELVFLANGDRLVSAGRDQTLRVWDTESGALIHVLQSRAGTIADIVVHDERIYSSSENGKLMVWDLGKLSSFMRFIDFRKASNGESNQKQQSQTAAVRPSSVAIAPDGDHVAVGFERGLLRLYSLHATEKTAEPLWTAMTDQTGLTGLVFTPDGKGVFLTDAGGNIKTGWRTRDGRAWDRPIPATTLARERKRRYVHRTFDIAREFGAVLSPDHWQMVTINEDEEETPRLRFWDLSVKRPEAQPFKTVANALNEPKGMEPKDGLLFSMRIPSRSLSDVRDFDFRCAEDGSGKIGQCWIAVALRNEKLLIYDLHSPYDQGVINKITDNQEVQWSEVMF